MDDKIKETTLQASHKTQPAALTWPLDNRELVCKKISFIEVKIRDMGVPLKLERYTSCFFWGYVGAKFVIDKLNDLFEKNKEVAVEIVCYDQNGRITRRMSLNYADNYDYIQSLKKRQSDYYSLGELIVISDGLEPKYILRLNQFDSYKAISLDQVCVYYNNSAPIKFTSETYKQSDSFVDSERIKEDWDLDEFQAAFLKILCEHVDCDRKILYDSVVQILQEQYENYPVYIGGDEQSVEYYKEALGVGIERVDGEVVRKMWTRNIAEDPNIEVMTPTILFKSGHCPINKPAIMESL